jgi:hypothetical protein
MNMRMVGVTGFEPATPASRTQCSSQAELHPVPLSDSLPKTEPGPGNSYITAPLCERGRPRARRSDVYSLAHHGDYRPIVRLGEDSRARNEDRCPRLCRVGDVIDFDTAVDLDFHAQPAPVQL